MAAIRLRNSPERARRELAAGDREIIRLMEERLSAEGAFSPDFLARRDALRRQITTHGRKEGRGSK
jgi:hypothetical protein